MWRSLKIRLNQSLAKLIKFNILSSEAKKLVAIQTIFTFASLISGTFLNIFLWKETQSLSILAAHNIAWALAIPLLFILNGYLIKRYPISFSLKGGLLILAVFYLGILLLGPKISLLIVPLGFIRGAGEALFWSSYNLLTFDHTHDQNRDIYVGVNGVFNTALGIFAPFLAAFLMVFNGYVYNLGYYLIFSLTIILFLSTFYISSKLKLRKKNSFRLERIWRLSKRNQKWEHIQKASFIQGFSGGIFGFLVGILTFVILKNETSMGNFAGIIGVVSLLINFLMTRTVKPQSRFNYALSGALLLSFSSILLPISLSITALLAFNLLRSIGMPLFGNVLVPLTFSAIEADQEADKLRYEYLVSNEIFLGLGRSLVLGLFIWFNSLVSDPVSSRFILVLVGLAPIIIIFYLSRVHYSKTSINYC
jgi:YQGE family putative transporter